VADALAAVLDDPTERRRLVDAGRTRAAGFTWDASATGLRQLYADAIEAR
jgi:glycosyltransferase involved in cell wall biosynthesis